MKKYFLPFILLMSLHQFGFAQSHFTLAPLFTDNMVLQQLQNVPVWGKGIPGTTIRIKSSWGKKVNTVIRADSTWRCTLKTPKAGGPFTISIVAADSTVHLKTVLSGEVWLCSGQSNMEMPLAGWPPADTIANAVDEIQHARYPKIRLFTVGHVLSSSPLSTCSGTWSICTPESAAKFSATAYFFGRKLFRELKVPIGLIQSDWGGTPVQAWTSEKFIALASQYADFPAKFKEAEKEFTAYMSWLSSHKIIDIGNRIADERCKGLEFDDSLCSHIAYNDSGWQTMKLPTYWEQAAIGNFDGVVWFRKKIEIPKLWINKTLTLELGAIDDYDLTFVNGKFVGGMDTGSPWQAKRVYTIPSEVVTDSILTIAVRVIDLLGGGGLWGQKEELNIHPVSDRGKINLSGAWKYLPVAEYRDSKFYLFNIDTRDFYQRPPVTYEISSQTPTMLYNGMIAPLVPFAMRGAIWYQGEGNVYDTEGYKTLFPLMIKNWRDSWQNNFSFYFVQIAPFTYWEEAQSQRLREAQFQSLSVPNTGMAVTLDIGEALTVHPANKVDVGERLARWALAKDYHKNIPYSGPLYTSFKIKDSTIVVSFKYADGLVVRPDNGKTNFQIAGSDSIFHPAFVSVTKKQLDVSSPEVKHPIAVRYAWENVVAGTLFNGAGLPASSFRTDSWMK